ncbi:class I SAM-dependent methyltransferase [Calothrix sp. FACHB-156]|nr:class I SAM-dependent methyltransferase [Calothrix sp. FACHB-156]
MPYLNLEKEYSNRGVNPYRFQAILENAGSSILDIGCGSGAYVLELAHQYKIRGIDFQYFESWNDNPELFSISDAVEINFPDNSVDTILSFETLEHLADPEKALRQYHRVCRKNLILTVPNCYITPGMRQSLVTYYHWIDRTHVNFFSMDSITELVQASGFRISKKYYINQISWIPLLLEAFDFSTFLGKLAKKILCNLPHKDYYITCLIVAEKNN